MFCHITKNWRGKTLGSFQTIVDSIGNTRTAAGLRVKAKLDKRIYPTGVKIPAAEMNALSLHRLDFQGEWNYEISSIVHQSAPCLALKVEHIISIKTLRVGPDGEQCLGGGLEQEVIEQRFVLIGDIANLSGYGEHDVEVRHR